MKCPYCSSKEDRVLESRTIRDGSVIRRRRECLKCGRRFNTREEIEGSVLMVVKKDGRREAFDRKKVLRGLMIACEKRPVPAEALENIADEVERTAYGRGLREIHSRDIGEMVIEALKALDQVAYVRFASVYRDFQDIDQFKEIVETLSRSVREAHNSNRDSQTKKEDSQEGRTDVA